MVGSADILQSVWWIISLQLLLPLLATLTPSPLTLCHDIPAIFMSFMSCLFCEGFLVVFRFFLPHLFIFFSFLAIGGQKRKTGCVFSPTQAFLC